MANKIKVLGVKGWLTTLGRGKGAKGKGNRKENRGKGMEVR